ncbi:MAG TPA: BON domain-containing protein [Pyrinomonadaceae bacterium]|nr:BON domain-containing protein [Pyrinomonadaceae bacterium]
MLKKLSILKITLAVLFLVATGSLNISAKTDDCTKTTDADLVKAVMKKIGGKFKKQMNHINVHVENGVVTLEGWAVTEKDKAKITELAQKVKCIKSVVNNLAIGSGGGCGAGTKPCGDICIPSNQTCNIAKGN